MYLVLSVLGSAAVPFCIVLSTFGLTGSKHSGKRSLAPPPLFLAFVIPI